MDAIHFVILGQRYGIRCPLILRIVHVIWRLQPEAEKLDWLLFSNKAQLVRTDITVQLHLMTMNVFVIVFVLFYFCHVIAFKLAVFRFYFNSWRKIKVIVIVIVSCHLILVCVNYDLYGSLHISSRVHARLNNQPFHPIYVSITASIRTIFYIKISRPIM